MCYQVQAHTAHQVTGQYIERWGVGARNGDFIWKASQLRRWWTSVPKYHLTRDRIQASFILKRDGRWGGEAGWRLVGAGFVAPGCFVLTTGHIDLVTVFPVNLQPDRCYSLFCNFASLKVRALRVLLCISGCGQHSFPEVQSQHVWVQATEHKG